MWLDLTAQALNFLRRGTRNPALRTTHPSAKDASHLARPTHRLPSSSEGFLVYLNGADLCQEHQTRLPALRKGTDGPQPQGLP